MKHAATAWLIGCMCLVGLSSVCAQNVSEVAISGTYRAQPLGTFLDTLSAQYDFRYFGPKAVFNLPLTGTFDQTPLPKVLRDLLVRSPFTFFFYQNHSLVFVEKVTIPSGQTTAQKRPAKYVVLGDSLRRAYGEVVVTGLVTDATTGAAINGARIAVAALKTGAITNEAGEYTLTLPTGNHTITYDFIGLQTETREVALYSGGTLDVELYKDLYELATVEINAVAADQNLETVETGLSKLDLNTLQKLPTFLGEVDVVKGLMLLPGVSTVGEGATGINVRGGSVDQNLILMDDAPLFNSSHLFGFFSLFNPDMVQSVELYKGGVPAQYGGRVASVMSVSQREGDMGKWKGQGGLGVVSSRLALEGPLVKDKLSLVIGGRAAYTDWVMQLAEDLRIKRSGANFYDLSAKLTQRMDNGDKLTLNAYHSGDRFHFGSDTTYGWNNTLGSLKFQHFFGNKVLGKFSAIYSKYQYQVENQEELRAFELNYGLSHSEVKADFTAETSDVNKVLFGVNGIRYSFAPGALKPLSERSNINELILPEEQAMEASAYLQDEWKLSSRVTLQMGLRYSYFKAGDQIYHGAEPRLAMRWRTSENGALKLGYNRMRQYIHLISNTAAVTPVDVWKNSNASLPPQLSDQLSFGYFHNFLNNTIESSVELYYKDISQLIDYKDGAELLLNPQLESELLVGEGKAYGLEILVNKKQGKVTGWASYSYARTLRKVDGPTEEETINEGKHFPANYDKPHEIKLVFNYQYTRRYGISANFTYATGRPFTGPAAKFVLNDRVYAHYAGRNQYRMPDYHRLDLSFTFDQSLKKDKKWSGSWAITLYNVYARRNAYSVFFRHTNGQPPQAYKLAVLGTIFPAVMFNFKF